MQPTRASFLRTVLWKKAPWNFNFQVCSVLPLGSPHSHGLSSHYSEILQLLFFQSDLQQYVIKAFQILSTTWYKGASLHSATNFQTPWNQPGPQSIGTKIKQVIWDSLIEQVSHLTHYSCVWFYKTLYTFNDHERPQKTFSKVMYCKSLRSFN